LANNDHGAALISTRIMVVLKKSVIALIFHAGGVVLFVMSLRG
jgi:hypothetical protein